MITMGLLSSVVFLVMAFMVPPPEDKPHWQRYFPNINVHPDVEKATNRQIWK